MQILEYFLYGFAVLLGVAAIGGVLLILWAASDMMASLFRSFHDEVDVFEQEARETGITNTTYYTLRILDDKE